MFIITVCLRFAASRRVPNVVQVQHISHTQTHTHKHLQMLMRNEHAIYPIPACCRSITSHRVALHLSHPVVAHIHVHIQPHAKRTSSVQHSTTQYGKGMYVSDTPDMEYNTYESNYEYDKCNINIIYIYIIYTCDTYCTVYHTMFCIHSQTHELTGRYTISICLSSCHS